jgi:hypothetical protein
METTRSTWSAAGDIIPLFHDNDRVFSVAVQGSFFESAGPSAGSSTLSPFTESLTLAPFTEPTPQVLSPGAIGGIIAGLIVLIILVVIGVVLVIKLRSFKPKYEKVGTSLSGSLADA